MNSNQINIFFFAMAFCLISGCTQDVGKPDYSQSYPQEVGKIILTKCAISGCHTDLSREAAADVSLTTWERMFEGSRSGAIVIPYRPDFSTLIFYINSYNEYGTIQLSPKMPLQQSALTREEVKTLYDWIANGAPNSQGKIKFSDNLNSRRFYVSNQGCDVVTTFDVKTMLAMRITDVGKLPGYIEAPHFIKVSPDNRFWYVSFLGSDVFQKFRVSDNALISSVTVGYGSWNTFSLSSDGKYAYLVDWSSNGKVRKVRTDSMTIENTMYGLNWSHGSCLNKTNDTLYVTSQTGNYLFKMPTDFSDYSQIVLDNQSSPSPISSLDPHEVLMNHDFKKYFVSCQQSNQIKVLSSSDDQVLSTIPVGDFPQEMAISKLKNYLFVTCMEDVTTFNNGTRGSVYVIDISTYTVLKKIYTGHQPHGLMIDEVNGRVYVTNRNVTAGGPSPHHASNCAGKNGYVTAIDLNTLQLVKGFKAEVSVDPYGYSIMH